MGFRLQRPPAKQQGSGSQGQPSPSLPDCERGAGCEISFCCFPEFWPDGAGVCSPMSVSCPLADCSPQELGWCRWGDRASRLSGPAGLGGHCWGICAKGLRTPNHASPQRRIHWVWVSGSRDPQQREGPGSPRQPIPTFPDVQWRAGCENGLGCFPEKRRGGAGIAPPGKFPVPLQTAGPRNSVGAFGVLGPWCRVVQLR